MTKIKTQLYWLFILGDSSERFDYINKIKHLLSRRQPKIQSDDSSEVSSGSNEFVQYVIKCVVYFL